MLELCSTVLVEGLLVNVLRESKGIYILIVMRYKRRNKECLLDKSLHPSQNEKNHNMKHVPKNPVGETTPNSFSYAEAREVLALGWAAGAKADAAAIREVARKNFILMS